MKLKFWEEFKDFALKGNMLDIAIGVIIGAAFNKVVDVLVKEVFLPPLSLLTDGVNLASKKLVLRDAVIIEGVKPIEEVAIGYGKLMEAGVDFFIIAFTVFIVVKLLNAFRKKANDPKEKTVPTPKNIELLDKIADLIEKQNDLLKKKD